MKTLLTTFFPHYTPGTAGAILFFVLGALLMAGITISDFLGQGADGWEIGMIMLFLGGAWGIYAFGRTDQRVGK